MALLPDLKVHLRMDTTEFDEQIKHVRDELATLPVQNLTITMYTFNGEALAEAVRKELLKTRRRTIHEVLGDRP